VIIRGYRMALAAARAKLEALAMDNGSDPVKFREDLLRIARTTLSSKLLQHEKDHFATLAVDAVLRLGG
ncbi:cct2, partial [Symbiodinium pilosum]